jgi:TRAP-type C4-dicarboxylate transport system substrate-binding protein
MTDLPEHNTTTRRTEETSMRTTPRTNRRLAAFSALTLPIALGAHAVATTDTTPEPVTLRMASPYDDPDRRYTPAVFHFVDKVAELSGGDLAIEMVYRHEDAPEVFSVQPDGEQQVVELVRGGDYDLAWAGTRVFDTLGLDRFAALHAPLLVDGYPLQEAIIESDLDEQMLAELEEIDLTGLAVLAGGLRKPIAVDGPLLSPDDFAGITFQLYRSDTQAAAVSALGATPTDVVAAVRDEGIRTGEIQGIEQTLRTYVVRVAAYLIPYVTANVNLWPETTVLLANPDALAGLTDIQVGWLYEAAADAAAASRGLHDRDADYVTFACAQGARFANATDADLAAIREAVAPVYTELAQDQETRGLIEQITALKATVDADPLAIPEDCAGVSPNATAPESTAAPSDPSVVNGVYQLQWTVAELTQAGVPADIIDQFRLAGTWTWTFQDGELTSHNVDIDGDPCVGAYELSGDVINIHPAPPSCPFLITATWELTDDALVLSNVMLNGAPDPIAETWLGTKPLARVE